ncbi:MAG: ABC transporter ATP-binding protein [Spiroplasma endosymbiont of Drosophila atripex]|nr:MAG: ABC transporter ATP-binding protein [Spiroplasma endosymbiont of Drosophila atripex]
MKKDNKEIKKDDKDIGTKQVTKNKLESSFTKKSVSKNEATIPPVTHKSHDKPESKEEIEANKAKLQAFKDNQKVIKKLTKTHSKEILAGKIISMTNNTPDTQTNVIELFDVKKSYLTGDLEYEVLKGVNLKIKLGDFVVILGPSGSGKTTLLNIISGLDKPNTGDVFVAGYNLSLLKDSHLTKFRRDNVGFIFQQYNLLTNLTARENAEVGENLAKNKNKNMSIDDIFQVIEMDEHMNKFPSQLSGGQQQRVSIGRALAKNPTILFCDEPTGALDEEMGRKVLEILLDVNRQYKTSIIMVTHNPNFQYVANTVINVKNGKIISVKNNEKPMKPSEINWS